MPLALLTFPESEKSEKIVETKESTHTKVSFCDYRYFEKLQGFVDLKVLSNNNCETLLPEPEFVQATICKLRIADASAVQMYEIFLQS